MGEPIRFEVGEPVTQADIPDYNHASKYDDLFKAVDQLEPGQWLPVTVEKERHGQRLIEIARKHGYRRRRRGLVVYIAKQEDSNGQRV